MAAKTMAADNAVPVNNDQAEQLRNLFEEEAEDDADIGGYNTVWEMEQEADELGNVQYWWKIAPGADLPSPYNQYAKPVYVPFVVSSQKNELFFLTTVRWNELRQIPFQEGRFNWARAASWKRNLFLTKPDGSQFLYTTIQDDENPDPKSPFWVTFWERKFVDGQLLADQIGQDDPVLGGRWEKEQISWKKWTAGNFARYNDSRDFVNRQGIGFVPKKYGLPPNTANCYVKLSSAKCGKSPGAASQLVFYDLEGALAQGIDEDEMYIEKESFLGLYHSAPEFLKQHGNAVAIRNKTGQVQVIECKHPNVQSQEFWKDAFEMGLKEPPISRTVRSRNVRNLAMFFVVPDAGSDVTIPLLTELIRTAKRNSCVPIGQNVLVRSETKFAQYRKENPSVYLLSISPFGDYQTWVHGLDMASYLENYPDHALPDNSDDLYQVERQLESMLDDRGPKIKRKDDQATKRHAKETSSLNWPGSPPPALVDWQTILSASGKRKNFPSQTVLMGGSASDVARVAEWQPATEDYNGRVSGVTDARGVVWDNPGVYPAEWLHRTAFSWGHQGGPGWNQISPNLIFGSSEANSIMTRYEKAWQTLFLKDNIVKKHMRSLNPRMAADSSSRISGFLSTSNTNPPIPIATRRADRDSVVTTNLFYGELTWTSLGLTGITRKYNVAVCTSEQDVGVMNRCVEGVNYWGATVRQPNLSFSLTYNLRFNFGSKIDSLLVKRSPLYQRFYPFQRGFFTRIESDVDQLLLDRWTDDSINAIRQANPDIEMSNSLPHLDVSASALSINPLTARVVDASSRKALSLGVKSLTIASTATPSQLPHAEVWRNAVNGETVTAGGVALKNPHVATMKKRHMVLIPLGSGSNTSADTLPALVAPAPISVSHLAAVADDQVPSQPTTITTPAEIANAAEDSGIPQGFVLSGTVELFGKFSADLYVFQGNAALGVCQIVPIKAGIFKISDYIPNLAGTDYEALQMQNIQLVYNEFTVGSDVMGTWLEADLVFSGPLQPVSDFLKNVCHQEKPALRVKTLLSKQNDWSQPIALTGLVLLGSLEGISVQIGDLIQITELGVSVGISRGMDPWPPYKNSWTHSLGFSGSMKIDMPHEIPAADAAASILISDDTVTLSAVISDEASSGTGFAGVEGLNLSQLRMTTMFPTSSAPSAMVFDATAILTLRDTVLDLSGFYAKDDWGFQCIIYDFDFGDLRNIYEDLFGTPLHLSDHEVVLDELSLNASPAGITISGSVTVEGHASANATISLSRLGLEISGSVADVPLEGDIVLKEASLDIFIGRQDDTTKTGPGTSFRFAVAGKVNVAQQEISASMYLDKDSEGATLWTVVGSFSGDLTLSQVAAPLKGTFLDITLRQVTLIASNMDGASADGAAVPAGYSVIKGVQIAAQLERIEALESSMGNTGAPVSSLTLQASYSTQTSSFELDIQLASPRRISMKSGTVASGDISLHVLASETPTLILSADFFVEVPNQADPLKFSGGLSINVDEAKLFIELANQWWNDPFGLSPQLRLGPDLALQIGIVYASPVYPSQLGVTAGLAVGDVSGKAAVSVSDAPNDELIMLEIENLGIRDLVSFASKLLEADMPQPDDFLRFKDVNFYLSTGVTIGTVVYAPGASFSCDAIVFGHEATVDCTVTKAQGQIDVKGTLQPVDVGPVTVSGYDDGTLALMEVAFGSAQQMFHINGGVRIGDLHSQADIEAVLVPQPSFHLKTELDFSTHLTFALEANMRGGGTATADVGTVAWLKGLDFDVDCSFRQDVLDFVTAQVNMQILTAKHAVDDGVAQAQATLTKAKANFEQDVAAASKRVDETRAAYEAKASAAEGALKTEQDAAGTRTAQLQAAVDGTVAALNDALAQGKAKLGSARDERDRAVRDAQQKVNDAQAKSDSDIDQHLRDLASARDNMQRQFGDAVAKVQSAQDSVNSAQSVVNDAQRNYDNAQRDCDNAKWYEKVYKCPPVAGFWTELQGVRAGLATANGILDTAKAVIQSPGYLAAQGAINTYQSGVEHARAAADGAMRAANATLQQTIATQDGLVSAAQDALTAVQTTGAEKLAADAAKGALTAYQATEQGILAGLQVTVDGLSKTTEALAFGTAQGALTLAQANTHDIDVASAAITFVQHSGEAVLDVGQWVVDHAGNILNIRSMDAKGDLRGLCVESSALQMRIVGTFADQPVDFSLDFVPGRTVEFVKGVFARLIDDVKGGVLKVVAGGV